jgi:uncharacterized protein (TIGR01777 family)
VTEDKMSNGKRVIVTGATGEIGTPLTKTLIERGYEVVVFSRNPEAAKKKLSGAAGYIQWLLGQPGDWDKAIDGAYAVINCAGVNMFEKRYRGAFARSVVESREQGTRALIQAMATATTKPQVFINCSSQGYYGITDYDDRIITEASPAGTGDKWGRESAPLDAEAFKAEALGVRTVTMRTGYVLDAHGGGLPTQVEQLQKGQGGATTPTDAWRSWIHIDDLVRLFVLALEDDRVRGGLNGTAPNPATSDHFANALSMQLKGVPNTRKFPGFLLKLFMGPAAEIMTHGKRVVPQKALDLGFAFTYTTIEEALADLVPKILARQAQGQKA